MIIAHRGASHDAPENTTTAIDLAWKQGADGVEIDVRLTKDGRIVLMHDATAERTGSLDRNVADMTLDELRALDVGVWKGETWAGERVPELMDVLGTVPAERKLFIEIKCGTEVIAPLKDALSGSDLAQDQIVIVGFQATVLKKAVRSVEAGQHLLLVNIRPSAPPTYWEPTLEEMLHVARDTGISGLDVRACQAVDAAFVRAVRDAGLTCYAWTVDDPAEARRLQNIGVDGITTNRPGVLRSHLP